MVVENQARQLQRWPSDEPDGDTVAPTTPPVQQSAKVQNTSKNRALLWGVSVTGHAFVPDSCFRCSRGQ